jgi:hypothetical protein
MLKTAPSRNSFGLIKRNAARGATSLFSAGKAPSALKSSGSASKEGNCETASGRGDFSGRAGGRPGRPPETGNADQVVGIGICKKHMCLLPRMQVHALIKKGYLTIYLLISGIHCSL